MSACLKFSSAVFYKRLAAGALFIMTSLTVTAWGQDAPSTDSRPTVPCTIHLLNAQKPIKSESIWSISNGILEYRSEGSLHDVRTENIAYVQCGSLAFKIAGDSMVAIEKVLVKRSYGASETGSDTIENHTSGTDYAALGKADAEKYYSMTGPAIVGFMTGAFILPPVIMACAPPRPNLEKNPNRDLYYGNPAYRKAYRARAHGKKAAGLALGMCTLFLLAGIASM